MLSDHWKAEATLAGEGDSSEKSSYSFVDSDVVR